MKSENTERRKSLFKTGVCSVSFRSLPFGEVIKLTRAAGLSAIEWGSDVHAPHTDIKRLKEIARAQNEAGVVCSSYGTYFRVGEDSPEELDAYIDAAEILGTKMLRIWCGNKNYEDFSEEERELIAEERRRCAGIAEARDAVLSVECHQHSFTDSSEGAVFLMESVNSKALRMYWQENPSCSEAQNTAYAKMLAKYTTNIHISAYANGKQDSIGNAIEKWRRYLKCFKGERALLLEFMPENDPEALFGEAHALKSIILYK